MKLEWKDSAEDSVLCMPELVVYLTTESEDFSDEPKWFFELLTYGSDNPIICKHFHARNLADAKQQTLKWLNMLFVNYANDTEQLMLGI